MGILRVRELLQNAQSDIDDALMMLKNLEEVVRTAPGPTVPDPRSPNAREHRIGATGLVEAMHLSVHLVPGARYKLVQASVIGEEEAQGKPIAYVSVKNRAGETVPARIVLATGYNGGLTFDDVLDVTNDKQPVEVVISTPFSPPNLGPLAIFIADENDKWKEVSDVLGNIGLPGGRHVGLAVEFLEV